MHSPVTHSSVEKISDLLARAAGWKKGEYHVGPRQVGCTNTTYKITRSEEEFALRLCDQEQDQILATSRLGELEALNAVAPTGLPPELLAFIQPQGHMLTRWIEAPLLPPETWRPREALTCLVAALRQIHNSPPIQYHFSPINRIEHYAKTLAQTDAQSFQAHEDLIKVAQQIARSVGQPPQRLVLCHNDLCRRNLFVAGGQLRIIDWECAGMNDPLCDLASFAANLELSCEEEKTLLELYFGRASMSPHLVLQFLRMKFLHCLREGLWFLTRVHKSSEFIGCLAEFNPDYDFRAHFTRQGEAGLSAARKLLSSPR